MEENIIPAFEDRIDEIKKAINKRKANWRVTALDFEDVEQIVITRIFVQYHTFDPKKGEFSHWLSRVISNSIRNILRDNLMKWSRPCISGCAFNTGGESCSKTPSGRQCEECIIFKNWKQRKESHFNVKQTLPLENHLLEVNEKPSNFVDIDASKQIIDVKLKDKLNEHEYEIYRLLYIENKNEEQVGKLLGYKAGKSMSPGYQVLHKIKRKIILMSKQIIEDEDLA